MAVDGLDAIKRKLDEYGKRIARAQAAALYQEALAIMGVSKRQVPVDTGRLRNSAFVGGPQQGTDGPEVALGYGTTYALPVHERTDVHHNPPTKAKFLEDPMRAAASGYAARLAARTKRNLENGVGMDIGSGGVTGEEAGGE